MIRYLIIACFVFSFQTLRCQYDTIIKYNLANESIEFVALPPVHDSLAVQNHTNSMIGTLSNFTYLEESISTHTFEESFFTDRALASDYYNVSNYPISSAVKLAYFTGDTLKHRCSGLLIANNLVLTAAHCVFYYRDGEAEKKWRDELIAYPAFDNGKENILFNNSAATEYFIFNSWYKGQQWDDIAILKLKNPIGIKTGWLGVGFNKDKAFLSDEIFHTLSYPGTTAWFDSTKVYDGDSLYYKYGKLKRYDKTNLLTIGLPGIPGESGSSLIYTDNDKLAYSVGVLSFGGESDFYKINKTNYPALKYIINNFGPTGINLPDPSELEIKVYPIPFSVNLTIESPLRKIGSISIINNLGQIILKRDKIFSDFFELDCSSFNSGLYFLLVEFDDNKSIFTKVLKM